MSARGSSAGLMALLVSNALAYTAEAVSMVVIPWFVLELTGSYAQMGIVGFFTVMPRVLATFFGGQIVDRIGFKAAGIASDVLSGLSVCAIPLLYAQGHLTFALLLVFVSIGAVFDGPGATARESLVPELTREAGSSLDRVNAYFQGVRRLALFVGPMIAGFLVAMVGTSNVLWLNAVVFALSALCTAIWIPVIRPSTDDTVQERSFWSDALFGLRYLRTQPLLLWLAVLICVLNFFDAPFVSVQLPALVNENYGTASRVGLLIGANGVGAVIGSLIFSAIAPRLKRQPTFVICFLIAGLMFSVLAMVPPFPVAWTAMVVMGLAAGPLNPILMSVRQERVPLQHRAKVFGATTSVAFIAIPLGQLLGGFTVEWFGVRAMLLVVTIGYTVMVVAMLMSNVMPQMDEPIEAEPGTAR